MTSMIELRQKVNRIDLVPMSRQQLRLEKKRNFRRKFLQIWFVDGIGEQFMLLTSEIERLQILDKWPEIAIKDMGIKDINLRRRFLLTR